MKYLILSAYAEDTASNATDELMNDVQEYLDKGWKPQGGVCVVLSPTDKSRFTGEDGYEAFQALTHDGEPE